MKMNKSKVFSKFYHTIDENGDIRFLFSVDQKEIEMKEIQDIFIKRYLFDHTKKETYGEVKQIDVSVNNDLELGENIINFSGIDKELKREGMYRYVIELYVKERGEEVLQDLDKPSVRSVNTFKLSKIEKECDIEYSIPTRNYEIKSEQRNIFQKVLLSDTQGIIVENKTMEDFKIELIRDNIGFVETKTTSKNKKNDLSRDNKFRDKKVEKEIYTSIAFSESSFLEFEFLDGYGKEIQMENWTNFGELYKKEVSPKLFLARVKYSDDYKNNYFLVEVDTNQIELGQDTINQAVQEARESDLSAAQIALNAGAINLMLTPEQQAALNLRIEETAIEQAVEQETVAQTLDLIASMPNLIPPPLTVDEETIRRRREEEIRNRQPMLNPAIYGIITNNEREE